MNLRYPALLLFAGVVGCASAPHYVDPDGGATLDRAALAERLAAYDVVFLGELHNSVAGHEQHLELVQELYQQRQDLVLSFEMFERDAAAELSAFVDGRGSEEAFVSAMGSSKWGNYERDYRPLLMFAKEHNLPVIAANVPRALAAKVAKEGAEAAAGDPHGARELWTPKDDYYERFKDALGMGGETLDRYYAAQCLKDCTMAESIADHLEVAGDGALVVHKNGNFHSDHHLGTVAMLQRLRPDLKIAVVTMVEMREDAAFERSQADFALFVPELPETKIGGEHPVHTAKGSGSGEAGDPHGAGDHGTDPHGADPHGADPHGTDPHGAGATGPAGGMPGRPALGFKPGYDVLVNGCLVELVTPDGPADRAGIKAGDVIVEVGKIPVDSFEAYMGAMSTVDVGSTIEVIVMRGSAAKLEELTFKVEVGSR